MSMNSNFFADFAKLQEMQKGKEISASVSAKEQSKLINNVHRANENINTRTNVTDADGKINGFDTEDILGDDGKPQKRSGQMQALMTYHDTQLGEGTSFGAKMMGYAVPGAAAIGLGMASNREAQRGDGFGAVVFGSGSAVIGGALALAGLGRVGEANINNFAKSITGNAERMKGFAESMKNSAENAAKDGGKTGAPLSTAAGSATVPKNSANVKP